MDRDTWLASLIPGDHVILESTDPHEPSRMAMVHRRGEDFILLTSGIRLNLRGKLQMGQVVWSIVPMLFGVGGGWLVPLK